MPLSQATRQLKLATPLGEDVLLLTAFSGREEMSRLFQFSLEMISDRTYVKADEMVGKNVTFVVDRAEGSPRYFNGFVNRFAAGDEEDVRFAHAVAVLVPSVFVSRLRSDLTRAQERELLQAWQYRRLATELMHASPR